MATTKSKSTPKTKKSLKATKKTVTKTAKKVSSNNSSVKTKVTTGAASKAAITPLERIRSLHISSTIVYLVFTGLVIGFVTTKALAVTLGIQARDEFAQGANVVLAPASEVIYNIEPKYVLAASLLVGALFSVLAATKLRNRYEATIANRTSGLRWVALGVSAALTLTFINMQAGISDIITLKLSAFLLILTAMLSFVAERENVGTAQPKWLVHVLSLVTGSTINTIIEC